MFHTERDASKIALVHLVARLRAGGFRLLDTQFVTAHLSTFGAVEVSRKYYHKLLSAALNRSRRFCRAAARPPDRWRARGRTRDGALNSAQPAGVPSVAKHTSSGPRRYLGDARGLRHAFALAHPAVPRSRRSPQRRRRQRGRRRRRRGTLRRPGLWTRLGLRTRLSLRALLRGGPNRCRRRRRLGDRRGSAFAVGEPDVVDRMLDAAQPRARGERPAGKNPLHVALQRDFVDLDEGVGVRQLGRRPRVADRAASPAAHRTARFRDRPRRMT